MSAGLTALLVSAATIAFVHTVIGVDHVIPFVALARERSWTRRKTAWVTGLCGLGHVGASVVLGFFGVGLGIALESLIQIEAVRGRFALWALIAFGLLYAAWGLAKGSHGRAHHHSHDGATPWTLFILFVFGPCEALIPMMMAPAVYGDWVALVLVLCVFTTVTIGTMLFLVLATLSGLTYGAKTARLSWSPVTAGLLIAASGLVSTAFGV